MYISLSNIPTIPIARDKYMTLSATNTITINPVPCSKTRTPNLTPYSTGFLKIRNRPSRIQVGQFSALLHSPNEYGSHPPVALAFSHLVTKITTA